MAESPPELLAERYRLGEQLGAGGAATVYRAIDERLGNTVAVKVLQADGHTSRSTLRRRLRAEARVMAQLQHPNVLPVLDIGSEGAHNYVVMALAEGGSVSDKLRVGLSPREAVDVMLPILSALAAAHASGVVHRDVKPQNILLDGNDTPPLADFGIALIDRADADRRTRTGVVMGSLAYTAPEQRLDARAVTAQADVYAAGTTLYALLTRRSPMDLFVAPLHSER